MPEISVLRSVTVGFAAAAAAALLLSGCGSQSKDNSPPSATIGESGAQVELGNTINYLSVGTTTDLDCADGKSLNIGGSNNTLTVKGTCASVNVGGNDNKITLDTVNKDIRIGGVNNTISYKAGEPKIDNTSDSNKIAKA